MLKGIQDRFEVNIPVMPEKIDVSTYSMPFIFALFTLDSCILTRFYCFDKAQITDFDVFY